MIFQNFKSDIFWLMLLWLWYGKGKVICFIRLVILHILIDLFKGKIGPFWMAFKLNGIIMRMCRQSFYRITYLFRAVLSGGRVLWGGLSPPPPQFLAKRLTLSHPGADYAHHSTTSPPDFQTLRRACICKFSVITTLVEKSSTYALIHFFSVHTVG